jgi:hypothetical protein
MTEREFTVTTRSETIGTFREEWLSGKASDGSAYMLDISINAPVLTVNVLHGDRVVRESVDLTDMLTEWTKQIRKEMKKEEEAHHGDD